MAQQATETPEESASTLTIVATIGSLLVGVTISQLLVPVTKAHTPNWLWVVDHCPQSDFACGSPQIGFIIPATIATLMISVVFWWGYSVAKASGKKSD